MQYASVAALLQRKSVNFMFLNVFLMYHLTFSPKKCVTPHKIERERGRERERLANGDKHKYFLLLSND